MLAHKAKIIYEFDAADIPGSYMYPAMARSFRAGGAQIATQFQYDPLPLARYNQGWQTHFLNLVCAPQKAVSFVIAGGSISPPAAPAGLRSLSRQFAVRSLPRQLRGGPERVGDAARVLLFEFDQHQSAVAPRPSSESSAAVIRPLVTYAGDRRLLPGETGARRVATGGVPRCGLGRRIRTVRTA